MIVRYFRNCNAKTNLAKKMTREAGEAVEIEYRMKNISVVSERALRYTLRYIEKEIIT